MGTPCHHWFPFWNDEELRLHWGPAEETSMATQIWWLIPPAERWPWRSLERCIPRSKQWPHQATPTLPTCRGGGDRLGDGLFVLGDPHSKDVENCGQCAHEGHPISSSGFENHHMPHSKCKWATYPPIIRHTDVFTLMKSAGAVLKLKEESVAKSYHHLWTYDGARAAGIHQVDLCGLLGPGVIEEKNHR